MNFLAKKLTDSREWLGMVSACKRGGALVFARRTGKATKGGSMIKERGERGKHGS